MAGKCFPNHHEKRRSKRKKTAQKLCKHDRLYGNIPLIHRQINVDDGKLYEWWQYDPDYQPALPRGAVRGDVRKQSYCPAHHIPKYFYIDEERECIQCGRTFAFRAKEQKYWYETLKFNFSSIPIRCLHCRRERRSEHAMREQIARAKAEVRSKNPAAYIALARAIVEYHEKTGHGDLNQAVAAARKAKLVWPDSIEPHLWEGIAHAMAGRRSKAQTNLKHYLSTSSNAPATLRTKAEKYVKA